MILVDTSIWVEIFRRGRFKTELATLIGNDQLCTHPFVLAELACGSLPAGSEHSLNSTNSSRYQP